MPATDQKDDANDSFPTEIERLRIENILLKQKADLEEQFRKHTESVEKQISEGKLKLGLAGLLLLCIAWYSTYNELGNRVQKRLDKEFETKEIKAQIADSATAAARKLIQKQITDYSDLEHSQLKCVTEKYGRQLFAVSCHANGGNFDELRAVCIDKNNGENYYEAAFPKIDCDKVWAVSETGTGPQPVGR